MNPVCSAIETTVTTVVGRLKFDIYSNFNYHTLQRANNKGADQTAQMCRLICDFCCSHATNLDFLPMRGYSLPFKTYLINPAVYHIQYMTVGVTFS